MSKRKRSDEEGQEEENFLEVGKEGEKDFRGKGKKTKARRAWNAKKRQTKPTTEPNTTTKARRRTTEQLFDPARKSFYQPCPSLRAEYRNNCLQSQNSAQQIKFSGDFVAMNDAGYRVARCTYGANEGLWYYEAEVQKPAEIPLKGFYGGTRPAPAIRLGWSTEKGDLQTPVGFDRYSYSLRSTDCSLFHQSRRKKIGENLTFGWKDVIGCLIYLGKGGKENEGEGKDEGGKRVEKKEDQEGKQKEEGERVEGSWMRFFLNGEEVGGGKAFEDLYSGTYYPAISMYYGATVKINPGPDFKFNPQVSLENKFAKESEKRDGDVEMREQKEGGDVEMREPKEGGNQGSEKLDFRGVCELVLPPPTEEELMEEKKEREAKRWGLFVGVEEKDKEEEGAEEGKKGGRKGGKGKGGKGKEEKKEGGKKGGKKEEEKNNEEKEEKKREEVKEEKQGEELQKEGKEEERESEVNNDEKKKEKEEKIELEQPIIAPSLSSSPIPQEDLDKKN